MAGKECMSQTSKHLLPFDPLMCFLFVSVRNAFSCSLENLAMTWNIGINILHLVKSEGRRSVARMGSVTHNSIWNPGSFWFSTLQPSSVCFQPLCWWPNGYKMTTTDPERMFEEEGGKTDQHSSVSYFIIKGPIAPEFLEASCVTYCCNCVTRTHQTWRKVGEMNSCHIAFLDKNPGLQSKDEGRIDTG